MAAAGITETEPIAYERFRSNFPFETLRSNQERVLREICYAYNSGFKVLVLEAPTGFGKSPVAIAVARTLGSSYICSATKELQGQYANDFPIVRAVKGMSNYSCLIKEDFIRNKTYVCGKCGVLNENTGKKTTNADECNHKTVEYGPCRSRQTAYQHNKRTCTFCQLGQESSNTKFHNGCRYRTYPEDYSLEFRNSINEQVELSNLRKQEYESWYKGNENESDFWMHTKNFANFEEIRSNFVPCPYYDQMNKGLVSSHSIFNYANYLAFLRVKPNLLPERNLLVLDEGHSIESQLVEEIGISLSIRLLRGFLPANTIQDITFSYMDSIEKTWLPFLCDISGKLDIAISGTVSDEIKFEGINYLRRINLAIEEIKLNPENWIVSRLETENGKVTKVQFKPLDVSKYCKKLFEKCKKTLIMSATILDVSTFSRNLGLDPEDVAFIQVGSDFPIQNRPIYPMNTAYLNYATLQRELVQRYMSIAVGMIMDEHRKEKGIIHCTSYAQVDFIQKYIDLENRKRLILTDPELPNGREEVLTEHFSSTKPTVLISPSLHTGLDLKDDRSRFQIIVKLPYPNRSDKWIEAKRVKDPSWYNWQTSIKLVQAYGRSVRSKDDWAKTYVLDSGFEMFVLKNSFPRWFSQAIVR